MVFLESWIKELEREGKSENSISSYASDVKKFYKWYEVTYDDKFQGRIVYIDVKAFESYLLNIKKQNINTVIRNIIALKKYNEFLSLKGSSSSIDILSTAAIKKTDNRDRKVSVLSNKELSRLRRAFHYSGNKRDIAVFEILLNTGVRVSELVNLQTDDIKLTERNGENNYSLIKIRQGKGMIYREVPLNNICRNVIIEYLQVRPNTISEHIFIGERGPLKRFAINKILKKYCTIARIEPVGPHILRHTFATKLTKESNIDIITISRLLGHSSTRVTEDFYINTSTNDKIEAVKSLEYTFFSE